VVLAALLTGTPSTYTNVAEPHHFYAVPAPDKNFDAAPAALAEPVDPAPTLLYELKFKHILNLSFSFDSVRFTLLKI
jgi:hypothetical protein